MTNIQTTILKRALNNLQNGYFSDPYLGICHYIYTAYPFHKSSNDIQKAIDDLTDHIARLIDPCSYLPNWLQLKGYITNEQHHKIIMSDDTELLRKLRNTRIAWLKSLIKQSTTEYLS